MDTIHQIEGLATLTYALQNGRMVHISTVAKGKKCNCVCPRCEKPLVAKTKGIYRTPHFAHNKDTECTVDKQLMSAYHRLSEQIIEERKQLMLPTGYLGKEGAKQISFTSVEIEERNDRKDVQPDIVGITEDENRLIVEIFYSHKVDNVKLKKIKALNLMCLEIDVRYISLDDLESFLLQSSDHRKWLNNPYYQEIDIPKSHISTSSASDSIKREFSSNKEKERTVFDITESAPDKSLITNEYLNSGSDLQRQIKQLFQKKELVCKKMPFCSDCIFAEIENGKCRFHLENFVYNDDEYVLCSNRSNYDAAFFKNDYLNFSNIGNLNPNYDPLEQYEAKLAEHKRFTTNTEIVDFAYSRANNYVVVWYYDNNSKQFCFALVKYINNQFVFQEKERCVSLKTATNIYSKYK